MKKIICSLVFASIAFMTYGQVSINGSVTDQNNNPLMGVDVYIETLHTGTTTDVDGNYILNKIPHGTFTITYSYIGFKTVQKELELHKNQTDVNVVLEESIFNMDEVIVSTPFNRLQSENVMKIEVLKAKQIKQNGSVSLIEGITSIAGVSQISTGVSTGKPVIRGLSGNRVLVYSQGVRLENQQFGGEHGLGVAQTGIESVEVIKGPASLLYGSDALGGVIYITPEKFAHKNKFVANLGETMYSNTQGMQTTFGMKQSGEQWKYLLRGAYNSHIDYKIPDENRVTNSRFNELNFNAGIAFVDDNISSELRYNYNQNNIGITEEIHEQTKSRSLELPYQKVNNHIIGWHNHVFFDNSKLDIDLGYIYDDRNEFEDEHGHEEEEHEEDEHELIEPALRMKLKTFSYNAKYHAPKFGNISIILGAQGMYQTNANYGEEILIPDATINDFGVYSTATIDFENSSLLIGMRYDNRNLDSEEHELEHHHNEHEEDEEHHIGALNKTFNSFNSFNGSIGYKFNIIESITTRINLATGYRAPNLAELTSNGVHHGVNRFEIGNPNLDNEQNFQADLAIEYTSKHFEFFANGFYNKVNNYIYLNPTGDEEDGAPVFEYTQSDSNLYGGEFGVHLHPHPLDWLHLKSSFEMVIGKQTNGNYLTLIPANKWANTFRAEFDINDWCNNGYASMTAQTYLEQNNVSDFETASEAYTLVNFALGGSFDVVNLKFDVQASLNNAFNKEYISHLSRFKENGIPNIGTNFVLGFSFNI